LTPAAAQEITDRALKGAGLLPAGATATFGNSSFEAYDTKGNRISSVNLDTHVSYSVRLENLRLIGPGAKIKLVLAGDGSVTSLNYAWRGLQKGSLVPLISPAEAERRARLQLADQAAGGPIELKTDPALDGYSRRACRHGVDRSLRRSGRFGSQRRRVRGAGSRQRGSRDVQLGRPGGLGARLQSPGLRGGQRLQLGRRAGDARSRGCIS